MRVLKSEKAFFFTNTNRLRARSFFIGSTVAELHWSAMKWGAFEKLHLLNLKRYSTRHPLIIPIFRIACAR